MMKRKILALLLFTSLFIGTFTFGPVNANTEVETYMNKLPEDNVAYCNFYGNLESNKMSFHDGVTAGVLDPGDPLYFEMVSLDGYEARKQYNANSVYMNVDKSFYKPGDTYFLVNIFYYDFGPSEGSYYLEYKTTSGFITQKKIVKPGNYPGWTYITLLLTDCDMTPHYDNGASLRIQNGAYNAWRRVEIVNLSDYVSEKKSLEGVDHLGLAKKRDIEKALVLPDNDPILMPTGLAKPCTLYDAKRYLNIAKMNTEVIPETDKERILTQGELLRMFMDLLKIDYSGQESIVEFARSIGLADQEGIFLFDNAQAINYNLGTIFYDALVYEADGRLPYIYTMYQNGFYGDKEISQIDNAALAGAYYKEPKKNPYITITDAGSGVTFKYINFYGQHLRRNYLTSPHWLHDGKRFLCQSYTGGYMYIYDTETQIMTYLGKSARPNLSHADGLVGEDGMIYYFGQDGPLLTLVRVDPHDPELTPKTVYRFPPGVNAGDLTVSRDGTWFSGEIVDGANFFNAPEGYSTLVVFHFPEESKPGVPDTTYQVAYYKFPEPQKQGPLNHRQGNPVYPNIMFFAHETETKVSTFYDTWDRSNIIDLNTGEVHTYNQGKIRNDKCFDLTTHESFSADGEWLTGVTWVQDGKQSGSYMGQTDQQISSALFKVRLDGSHRQLYYSTDFANQFNHTFFSEDMKFAVGDAGYISIMCLDTHQLFQITSYSRNTSNGHPFHPHAQIARGHRMASWGHTHKGILGIAWYDFTHIEENEIAKGGRYKVNGYVECVSYEGLECESENLVFKGKECQAAKAGKEIFYSINPEIADTTNNTIRLTFDYYDNDRNPIVIKYTRGVRISTDERMRFDKKIKIAKKGTGKWKTAVVLIKEANCETAGKYETDFTISGGSATTYIANMKVEALESVYKKPNNFTNAGGSAILADPSVIYEKKDEQLFYNEL